MKSLVLTALALSLGLGAAVNAVAQETAPAQPAAAAAVDPEEKARSYFTDLPVVTQDGETMRFYSDVLKDQVVLIAFIFTNCGDACPLITEKMVQSRAALEGELGQKVRFISLSVDPERDTPEAMKAFAAKHGADQPNWLFLTGDPQNVNFIVKRLGQYTEEVEAH
jgi:protein SCO1/2